MVPIGLLALTVLAAIGIFAGVAIAENMGVRMPDGWRLCWRARTGAILLVLGIAANVGMAFFS